MVADAYDDPLLYDRRTLRMARDVRLYRREASRTWGPVLELGCGTGRILLPLAAAGHPIVGLDLSLAMLTHCRDKARQQHLRVALLCADMRRFALRRRFDLIIIAYQSLHDLPGPSDWAAVLQLARDHLTPTGRLILDERVPPTDTGGALKTARTLRAEDGAPIELLHEVRVDDEAGLVSGTIVYRGASLPGGEQRYGFRGSFLRFPAIVTLLGECGLQLESRWADEEERPWAPGDPRCLFVARPA